MKCDTCDQTFPDSSVKVWNGKRVCPTCFQTLAGLPGSTSESKVPVRSVEPVFRVNPEAYIDISAFRGSGPGAAWSAADTTDDLLALARIASESGKREISAGEARQWGACLIINVKARIAKILAEDLGMPITDAQAFTIARNYLSGVRSASGTRMQAELCVCVPLSEEERRVAEEIGYHAWKAYAAHEKRPLTEEQLRSLTSQPIAFAENRPRKEWWSWKSAFDGAQQRMRDSAAVANDRAVLTCMAITQGVPAAYSQYGPSLGIDR